MERLALKKIIYINDEVKPFSRKYIAAKLKSIDIIQLNHTEKQELDFYKEEYAYELQADSERWFLYSYSDSLFQLRVSPAAGYGISTTGEYSGHIRWPGLSIYAAYGNSIGAFFDYKDIGEFGKNVDRNKELTPLTGHFVKDAPNGIEFSDTRGGLTYDFQWGSLALLKDHTIWGHGRSGSMILSDKAASFPQVRLQLNPVPWLRFNYIHGWLNSLVLDSSSFYYNNTASREPFLRQDYVNKYIAANILTISPANYLDLSIGNSFVYSGNLRPEMFIPFIYYKVMDHNTGRGETGDGNGQIFFDAAVKYPATFQFYSTLMIDLLEVRELLKGNLYNSRFGYTAGFRKVDLFIDNLSAAFEYSKSNPFLYENKDQTSTYKHIDYSLGHWMGENADHLKIQFDYILLRGLRFALYAERLRKGGLNDILGAYKERVYVPFLSGALRKDYRYGLKVSYEIFHDLFVRTEYEFSYVTDEDKSRTPLYLPGKKHNFFVLVNYGL